MAHSVIKRSGYNKNQKTKLYALVKDWEAEGDKVDAEVKNNVEKSQPTNGMHGAGSTALQVKKDMLEKALQTIQMKILVTAAVHHLALTEVFDLVKERIKNIAIDG